MNINDLFIPYKAIDALPINPTTVEEPTKLTLPLLIKRIKLKAEEALDSLKEIPINNLFIWVLPNIDLSESQKPKTQLINLTLSEPKNTFNFGKNIINILLAHTKEFKAFTEAYDRYLLKHPEDNDLNMRMILTSIAAHESNYKANAKNPKSSAIGYFQMIDSTRKAHSSVSKQDFIDNPEYLIGAAVNLYKTINNKYIIPNLPSLLAKGINLQEAMYGYWFRPASMNNYLKTNIDTYTDAQGTTLNKVWQTYKKLGGNL